MSRSAAVFMVGLVGILLTGCASSDTDEVPVAAESTGPTVLENAHEECVDDRDLARIGDDGDSLILDGRGEKDLMTEMGEAFELLGCTWTALSVPDSVTARMESTRALDGSQSADWEGMSATWSYHPDSGMDVIYELAP